MRPGGTDATRQAPTSWRIGLVSLLLLTACSRISTQDLPRDDETSTSLSGTLVALLLNGGDRLQVNYHSHLRHLQEVVRRLELSGVDPARVTIFASDGSDPKPDLATREVPSTSDFWLLPRSGVGEHLRPPLRYVNSSVEGFSLRPATHEALDAWFAEEGSQLVAGDTLLLYVTDHGAKNDEDLANNTILLWGESLSVSELQELLARLDPGVRIVMIMSQCFGGSFANAIFPRTSQQAPLGNVCGYFATTADRFAFGCYPENRGEEDIGHSHRLFAALDSVETLFEAHRQALVTDRTPDVPNTSSDFYLRRLLEREADASGRPLSEIVDELLGEAWQNRAAWEPEIRLIDRIAHSFGLFGPRSLAELDDQTAGLPELSDRLKTYAKRWKDALEALRRENWNRFLASHPEWRPRFETAALRSLDRDQRRATTMELLADLVPFSQQDAETFQRLLALKRKADDARDARYRMEVRLGAVLRIRTLLTSIAGRVYLERIASASERASFEQLTTCEDLALAGPTGRVHEPMELPAAFRPLAEERRLIESVMPSWMGIRYRPVKASRGRPPDLPRGAATVLTVYPDSPAEAAGLQVGDILLGTPENAFEEPHAVREWIMLSQLGRPTSLERLREGERGVVTLVPGSFPLELPKLPGPPKIGSAAPPLNVKLLRGETSLSAGTPRLLFFWATWCRPCKQSLPELLAFGADRGVEIVAVTDEAPDDVEAFLADFDAPFPPVVATDPYRNSFRAYGVSGTPTFVLVDAQGVVRQYQRGYRRERGLGIDGWAWRRSSR